MKIKLVVIGKTNISFVKSGINEYVKRLSKYISFEIKELADVKNSNKITKNELKIKEQELLQKNFGENDEIILLDENGKEFSSEKFSEFIEKKTIHSSRNLTFVVGGAYGFSDFLLNQNYEKIALSKMTFSHQLIRLIFVEQLYRAFSIIKNEPYHH